MNNLNGLHSYSITIIYDNDNDNLHDRGSNQLRSAAQERRSARTVLNTVVTRWSYSAQQFTNRRHDNITRSTTIVNEPTVSEK